MKKIWLSIPLALLFIVGCSSDDVKQANPNPLTNPNTTSLVTDPNILNAFHACFVAGDESCMNGIGLGNMIRTEWLDANMMVIPEGAPNTGAMAMSVTFELGETLIGRFQVPHAVPLRSGCIRTLEPDGNNGCTDAGCADEAGYHCEVTKLKGCGCYRPGEDPDWIPNW